MTNTTNYKNDCNRIPLQDCLNALDQQLYDRYFREYEHINDIYKHLSTVTNNVNLQLCNANINNTTKMTKESNKQSVQYRYANLNRSINICNINIQGFNDHTKQFQFLNHCEQNNSISLACQNSIFHLKKTLKMNYSPNINVIIFSGL